LSANESIYLLEGDEKAVLIDAGTKITDLDKIVMQLTDKPVTLILTHVHPDHVGAAGYFPEVYLNVGDKEAASQMMPNYKGEFKYLKDDQIIDLGGRQLRVVFTPAHTLGSTTYIDKKAGYGFSGDSFGSGNLLLFAGTFSDLIATCEKMHNVMNKEGITKLFPGHYNGTNPETLQRITDMITLSKDVLSGKEKGEDTQGNRFGFNHIITKYGVRINYSDNALK
jgi:glyoxylase-like metal-dependent hydrolase (beta-lactamase superfamily II)